jgi:hypothetical protein
VKINLLGSAIIILISNISEDSLCGSQSAYVGVSQPMWESVSLCGSQSAYVGVSQPMWETACVGVSQSMRETAYVGDSQPM